MSLSLIDEELGKCLSAKEVAQFLNLDEKTVRFHYRSLGGMRLGRRFVFFERRLIDAIQTRSEVGSPSAQGRTEEGEGISDEDSSDGLGKQDEAKARKRLEREDRHGLYR
jgi:hypothetical protein